MNMFDTITNGGSLFFILWPFGFYFIGILGLFFYLNNLIRLLILLELFILTNTIFLVVLVMTNSNPEGCLLLGAIPIFLATAAADAAVGLGLLVALYRRKKNLHPEESIQDSSG